MLSLREKAWAFFCAGVRFVGPGPRGASSATDACRTRHRRLSRCTLPTNSVRSDDSGERSGGTRGGRRSALDPCAVEHAAKGARANERTSGTPIDKGEQHGTGGEPRPVPYWSWNSVGPTFMSVTARPADVPFGLVFTHEVWNRSKLRRLGLNPGRAPRPRRSIGSGSRPGRSRASLPRRPTSADGVAARPGRTRRPILRKVDRRGANRR